MRRAMTTALNQMQVLPGFDKAFLEIQHTRMQKEVDAGCRAIAETEIRPGNFERGVLDQVDMDEQYDKLCSTFPTLMTGLVAVASNERSCKAVKVFSCSLSSF